MYQSVANPFTNKYLWLTIMSRMRYTFAQFKQEYPDDAACLKAVLENRYGDTCPKCGTVGVKWHPVSGRKTFVCSECDKHISPLADTIFRKSETSLFNWFHAIYLFSVSKNGVSAKELERVLGVTYKTAWRMAKQIRKLMSEGNEIDSEIGGDKPSDIVEVDETYIGGRKKNAQGGVGKAVVFGMVERGGIVKAEHVRTAGTRVLIPRLRASIATGTTIYTDQANVYANLNKMDYKHDRVVHSKGEYVRGQVYTNTIEGFWSQLKRSIDRTYHAVSPKYLQHYVDEFAFRYNFRGVPIGPVLLERAAKRV
jgi:transposase